MGTAAVRDGGPDDDARQGRVRRFEECGAQAPTPAVRPDTRGEMRARDPCPNLRVCFMLSGGRPRSSRWLRMASATWDPVVCLGAHRRVACISVRTRHTSSETLEQRRGTAMRVRSFACAAVVGAFLLGSLGLAHAAEKEAAKPDATIEISAKALAAGAGYSWGGGKLKYQGKAYDVTIDGLTVGAVGMSSITASGEGPRRELHGRGRWRDDRRRRRRSHDAEPERRSDNPEGDDPRGKPDARRLRREARGQEVARVSAEPRIARNAATGGRRRDNARGLATPNGVARPRIAVDDRPRVSESPRGTTRVGRAVTATAIRCGSRRAKSPQTCSSGWSLPRVVPRVSHSSRVSYGGPYGI